jgi:hypothetical protein
MKPESEVYINLINSGLVDEDISAVKSAIVRRTNLIQRDFLKTLIYGDRLKFTDKVSPKYLRGVGVTFQGLTNTNKLIVRVDDNPLAGKFKGIQTRAALDLLERE